MMRRSGGFTLIELLIVMAMMGVIMGAVYSLYITTQRSAYTQDETVDVQQNLRIAMDAVTRDLRMAGMLVEYAKPTNPVFPIQTTLDNTGPNGSDGMTINMASAVASYARIDSDITPGGSPATFFVAPAAGVLLPDNTLKQTNNGDGDVLQVGDVVRIIRPLQGTQPSGEATFMVTAVTRQVGLKNVTTNPATPPTTSPSVTLADNTGVSMAAVQFKSGDIIAKVNADDATTPSPNTVQYAVVTYAAAPATVTTDPNCPVNQRCLARCLNNEVAAGGPVWQIVAQNITNFQLTYLLDGNVFSPPTPLPDTSTSLINAVMVTISGETVTTRLLSGNVPKTRQLTSVVKLRNRRL